METIEKEVLIKLQVIQSNITELEFTNAISGKKLNDFKELKSLIDINIAEKKAFDLDPDETKRAAFEEKQVNDIIYFYGKYQLIIEGY